MLKEEAPATDRGFTLTPRALRFAKFGIVAVVVFGVVLRFLTTSGLWLDEALTVDIARLPLHQIPAALKRDGAPPLFYVLLHFWMRAFGDSDVATRALSGILGVLALPVAWLAARRVASRAVAWTVLVLLASSSYAVYYATEARMYSLVIFLTACGVLALHRAVESPKVGNCLAVAVVTAALLYSQYWSIYLVGAVGLWLLWNFVHEFRAPDHAALWRLRSAPALGAVIVGALAFVPWVPTFSFQTAHTGTPWSAPANFSAVITAVTGYTDNQASLYNVVTNQSRLLALIYFAMAALALFGIARNTHVIDLDLRTVPRARGLTFIVVATLFAAIAGGLLSQSAFSSRYAAVVFFPLLLLVAVGTTTLLSQRARLIVISVAVLCGVIACAQNITTQRTEAPKVASVLNAHARAGDVVAFCPDQIGPDVYRLTAHPNQYHLVTFPRGSGPQFVDWVDYLSAVNAGNPADFVQTLLQRAGDHPIWLVWQVGYQGYGNKCGTIASALLSAPHRTLHNWVLSHPARYYEPMILTEFSPAS